MNQRLAANTSRTRMPLIATNSVTIHIAALAAPTYAMYWGNLSLFNPRYMPDIPKVVPSARSIPSSDAVIPCRIRKAVMP